MFSVTIGMTLDYLNSLFNIVYDRLVDNEQVINDASFNPAVVTEMCTPSDDHMVDG